MEVAFYAFKGCYLGYRYLIIFGAIMIKLTNNITWLGALFNSVSARTAGFSTFNLSNFSNAGIIVMIVLMLSFLYVLS